MLVIFLALSFYGNSQNSSYLSLTIPDTLSKNANAVIRLYTTTVNITSVDNMVTEEKRVVTVLNSNGNKAVAAQLYYDNHIKVKHIQAIVFDAFGQQIKKIRKNDFKDVSAVDGGTLYSDSRILYLDYTPITYPYTIEFTTETSSSNTAFIPSFTPIRQHFVSVENASYKINYPDDMVVRKHPKNIEGLNIQNSVNSDYKIIYNAINIPCIQPEQYSPAFKTLVPRVLFAANQFNYEGVKAVAKNWDSMGKWFNDNLLSNRYNVSKETSTYIKSLVANEPNTLERAKKVYKYVQDNTRYISVQVGIGGMQPISALDVDRLKYGDCKGLTNYTKALLKIAGVTSYYTRLYASAREQLSVNKNFVSFGGQTNHVILNIPQDNKEDVWLECTSQDVPFGFIGDFTDDRDVLVITPNGGKIKHTKKYTTEENTQVLKGSYQILEDGGIMANVSITSKGIQYDDKYRIANYDIRAKKITYKKRYRYLNSLVLDKIEIENNKQDIKFIENLGFSTKSYSKKAGKRLLFTANALNRNRHIPNKYDSRTLPIKINRGFIDDDAVQIKIPKTYAIESYPKNTHLKTKFGTYTTEFIKQNDSVILYKRHFKLKDGTYSKNDYTAFRNFYKDVSNLDNAKIALIKI